jgi:hypothetical protein
MGLPHQTFTTEKPLRFDRTSGLNTEHLTRYGPLDDHLNCIFIHRHLWGKRPLLPPPSSLPKRPLMPRVERFVLDDDGMRRGGCQRKREFRSLAGQAA